MSPFLQLVAQQIYKDYQGNFHTLCIVLPNKRGALFLKRYLIKLCGDATWVPLIISVEELVENLSNLVCPDSITLTIELYNAWTSIEKNKEECFTEFMKWSTTVLHDFNELDRHLVEPKQLFQNLNDVRQLENWSLNLEPLTEFQKKYLSFMEDLGTLYEIFKKNLLNKGMAWQGLAYRVALLKLEKNSFINRFNKIFFCGFNALNKAEIEILVHLKKVNKAEILWDIDNYYFEDEKQEAGNFLRKNFKNTFLKNNSFITDNLLTATKEIEIVGTPRNMGQVIAAASQIRNWLEKGLSPEKMAIVLADESLLFPLLSVIPDEVATLNITLEYPLQLTAVYDFYLQLIQLQLQAEKNNKKEISFYYKDLYKLIYNPCFKLLYGGTSDYFAQELVDLIKRSNVSFVGLNWLVKNGGDKLNEHLFLFQKWHTGLQAIEVMEKANENFKNYYYQNKTNTTFQKIELEFVLSFSQVVNRLKDLITENPAVNNLQAVFQLLKQVVSEKTVPFFGEPLAGLQVMGVLETRTLDFENLLVLGLNEGVLPAGKGGNSFIPFDLKKYFDLPMHSEKDAVYAYHFYRLIQRAQNICLIYNTQTDNFGSGEKSRFLTQIELELQEKNKNIIISKQIAGGQLPTAFNNEINIPKDDNNLIKLEKKCLPAQDKSGLSPSSLNLFKDCSLKFYFKYIAKIQEEEEVEEDMEAGTFGSILHGALENLYTTVIDKNLIESDLKFEKSKIEKEIKTVYESIYQDAGLLRGKNYLAVNIIEQHILKMLNEDRKLIKTLLEKKQNLKIIALEKELSSTVTIQANQKKIEIKISGKCDRLDWQGDYFRIVDYKSSIKKPGDNFKFTDFENLFDAKDNNKLFQLFIYAWLAYKNNLAPAHLILPCIIPFKNYSGNPQFVQSEKNNLIFSTELLQQFEAALIGLIEKMFNSELTFAQTENAKNCEYCGYKLICNR